MLAFPSHNRYYSVNLIRVMAVVMTKGPEKALEKLILDWLNTIKGCFAFKVNTTGIYDPKKRILRKITNPHIHKGTSDILGLYRGRFFAIEVKHGYGKPSKQQKLFITRVVSNGGVAWTTNNFEETKIKFINTFGLVEHEVRSCGSSLLFNEEF